MAAGLCSSSRPMHPLNRRNVNVVSDLIRHPFVTPTILREALHVQRKIAKPNNVEFQRASVKVSALLFCFSFQSLTSGSVQQSLVDEGRRTAPHSPVNVRSRGYSSYFKLKLISYHKFARQFLESEKQTFRPRSTASTEVECMQHHPWVRLAKLHR